MLPRPISAFRRPAAHATAAVDHGPVSDAGVPPVSDETQAEAVAGGDVGEYAATPTVYNGASRLLKWSMSGAGGATVRLHLSETSEYGEHPFRGMRWGKENGQLLRVVVSTPEAAPDETASVPPGTTLYAGEAVLLWWADDCANGMSVKIGLNDGPDGTSGRHPFYGLAEGKTSGESLVFVAWTMADDDTPQDPQRVRRREPFRDLGPVKQSQILCRDGRFHAWLKGRAPSLLKVMASAESSRTGATIDPSLLMEELPSPDLDPKAFADAFVRRWCGIETRAVMNEKGPAADAARTQWVKLLGAYEDDVWGRR